MKLLATGEVQATPFNFHSFGTCRFHLIAKTELYLTKYVMCQYCLLQIIIIIDCSLLKSFKHKLAASA